MRIAIFGGCGYIGTALTSRLLQEGHSITSIHRSPAHFSSLNHQCVSTKENPSYFKDTKKAKSDVAIVLQSGSIKSGKSKPPQNQRFSTSLNCLGQKIIALGAEKVIFASSGGSLYEDPATQKPIGENASVKILSTYAQEKLSVEEFLQNLETGYSKLQILILRIANVYGPLKNYISQTGLIPTVISKGLAGKPVEIYGEDSIRDYIFLEDLIELFIGTIHIQHNEKIVNVGTGIGTNNSEIVSIISEKLGLQIDTKIFPKDMFSPKYSVLDPTLALKTFNWGPKVCLDQGIDRLLSETYGIRGKIQ
jgi:UDP-glucose 4-epimerase